MELLAQDFSNKANDLRVQLNRQFELSLRSQDELHEDCEVLKRSLQEERLKRNQLETECRELTRNKRDQMVLAVRGHSQEVSEAVELVKSQLLVRQKALGASHAQFSATRESLSKAMPEHYLKAAEDYRTAFAESKKHLYNSLREVEKQLRERKGQWETYRGATTRQLEDLSENKATEVQRKQENLLKSVEQRKEYLTRCLEEASQKLGLS